MALNQLGRAIMKHQGDYSPTTDYVPLDCCYLDGSTYFCKEPTTGNAPPNATYWVLMSTSASTVDRDAAEAAALAAAGSASSAANQVGLAAAQVTLAQGHATIANTKAGEAASSATAANDSAGQAQAFAGDAEQAAEGAAGSATAAEGFKNQAQQAAASVDGPGLNTRLDNHRHDGTVNNGVKIDFEDLTGCPYAIGDIIETKNETSPATRWPGTVWASIGAGRVIVGVDPSDPDFDTVGKQGGEKTHIQTIDEMPPHSHDSAQDYLLTDKTTQTGKTTPGSGWYTPGAYKKIPVQGGGQPMNIMQPYETAYRYIRTA